MAVWVSAVVYFRIVDAVKSVINIEDHSKSTKLFGATTLRKILGTKSLQDILSDRESIAVLLKVIFYYYYFLFSYLVIHFVYLRQLF